MATALKLAEKHPRRKLLVLEKERELARHQTGHNSGVIHSGIYYKPGSVKAETCVAGRRALLEFCDGNGIPYELCGKVIVATQPNEVARLEELLRQGTANGVQGLELIGPELGLLDQELAKLDRARTAERDRTACHRHPSPLRADDRNHRLQASRPGLRRKISELGRRDSHVARSQKDRAAKRWARDRGLGRGISLAVLD